MGCDIHIVIERKWEDRWVGVQMATGIPTKGYGDEGWDYHLPAVGQRDYAFFARLAGVRGDGPEPNGLPDDMSDLAMMATEGWNGDGHSHGHLPLHEFAMRWCAGNEKFMVEMAAERLQGDDRLYSRLLHKASAGACSYDPDYGPLPDEFRVIFWFDN
jgi:hypothetical protein